MRWVNIGIMQCENNNEPHRECSGLNKFLQNKNIIFLLHNMILFILRSFQFLRYFSWIPVENMNNLIIKV